MFVRNLPFNDADFLSSFEGSLKLENMFTIKIFTPATLMLAIEKARMKEKAIEVVQRRNKVTTKPFTIMSHNSLSNSY